MIVEGAGIQRNVPFHQCNFASWLAGWSGSTGKLRAHRNAWRTGVSAALVPAWFFRLPGLLAVAMVLAASTLSAQSGAVLIEAERLRGAQRYPDVIRLLREHARTQPDAEAQVFLLLSYSYRASGNAMMALDACQEGERRHPRSGAIAKCIARLLLAKNPSLSATERYLRIAVSDPGQQDAEAHFLYAQWACANGRNPECLRHASLARELSRTNLQAILQMSTLMGLAHDRENQVDAAAEAFAIALEANQNSPVFDYLTAFEQVLFLVRRDSIEEAKRVNGELLERAPLFAPALFEQAKLYSHAGELAESAKSAEQALRHVGADAELERAIRMHLADAYMALGDTTKAQGHRDWLERR